MQGKFPSKRVSGEPTPPKIKACEGAGLKKKGKRKEKNIGQNQHCELVSSFVVLAVRHLYIHIRVPSQAACMRMRVDGARN